MSNYLISKELSNKILMVGVYYKHHAPGGMAAVIQYYSQYIENLNYVSSWKLTNIIGRIWYAGSAMFCVASKLLLDRNVKILHIHTAADTSFYRKMIFTKMGKIFGKKVILHMHSSRFKDFYNEQNERKKKSILQGLMKPDKLLVLSQSWKEWFQNIGIPAEKIEILHNITETPIKLPYELDGKMHLLFLGELGQRKGVFDLLKGIANHKESFKNKIILRIGGNKNEDKLKKFILDNDLSDFVFFEGWVSGNKKKELLNWADIYVLPSFNEGLPIGILEAMSYGCAIISTPVGGIPEVVIPNKNGLLVEAGNSESIAKAINTLIEKHNLDSYRQESLRIVEPYLPNPVIQHLKEIYNQLLTNL